MTPEKRVAFAVLLCAAIIGAGVMLRDAHVTGDATFGTTDFTTQAVVAPKQVILIIVDGMQYNHYVTMLGFGNLSNFTRLLSRGGFNTTLNITKHTSTVTAPGNAEIYTGLGSSITGVTSDNCSTPVPVNTTIFERLKQFNASIATGTVYGKQTCYIPNGVLGNAMSAIDWFQNRSLYTNTNWTDNGDICAYARNASTKAQEFIVNNTNRSFFLVPYFGNPDCSGHVGTDNSVNYNNSFIEVDYALGILLDTLRDQGIENNTAIIISTDHGWNEGTTGHSTFNADTAIIPLITNNRSVIANATILGVRQQCDIAPTVLSYFGVPSANYSDIIANGCYSMYDSLFDTLTGCATINASTTLGQNIQAPGSGSCIIVNADNITLSCAGFSIGGNAAGTGINVTNRANVTIKDCVLENFTNNIVLNSTNASVIVNTTARKSTSTSILVRQGLRNLLANNTVSGDFIGILLFNGSNNTLRSNNVSGISTGITLFFTQNNTLINDTGASTSGTGIFLTASINNTLNSVLATSVSGNGLMFSSMGLGNNVIANTTGRSSSGIGVYLTSGANLNTLLNVTAASDSNAALAFDFSSGSNLFNDTTLLSNSTWLSADSDSYFNTLTNASFVSQFGGIAVLRNFTLPNATTVTLASLNITSNRAFLNSTNLSFLNQTAVITLNGVTSVDPKPQVALVDGGAFSDCLPTADPFCTELSFSGGVFVFNVSHFTTFASFESADVNVTLTKSDSPDPVNASGYLTYTITVNVSVGNASNVTLTDVYPAQVIFNGSQPAPLAGTNNTFVLGNLSLNTSTVVNITVLVLNVSNNTIINNTANISFQNSTGGIGRLNVTENTTVINLTFPAPSPSPTSSGGTSGGGGYSVRPTPNAPSVAASQNCFEGWACEGWSRCENGAQERACVDLNHCGTESLKPATTQSCASPHVQELVQEEVVEQPAELPPQQPQQPIQLQMQGTETSAVKTAFFTSGSALLWLLLFIILGGIIVTIAYAKFMHRAPEAPEPDLPPAPGREEPLPAPELDNGLAQEHETPFTEELELQPAISKPEPEVQRALPKPRVARSREELEQIERKLASIESSLSRSRRAAPKRSSARRRTRK
jgi:parallel beta-helix repeat protein